MKYSIIYADPPWQYPQRSKEGTKFGKAACHHYDFISWKDMRSLNIEALAEENCALFLWCTSTYLDKQIEIAKGWGFRYVGIAFNWIKKYPKKDKFCVGPGHYTRTNSELCLLFLKGKMKRIDPTISQIHISPRQEHSKKPDEIREKIVKLFGELPRIELFARQKYEGWDSYGNEVQSNIILTTNLGTTL